MGEMDNYCNLENSSVVVESVLEWGIIVVNMLTFST